MDALVAYKNEEDPIKDASVDTTSFIDFSDAQGQLTPKSVIDTCLNSNPSTLFIVGLVNCKNEEDPSKNEGTRVVTTFLPV